MKTIRCPICDKRMHGYGQGHVDYMLKRHMEVHEKQFKRGEMADNINKIAEGLRK